MLNPCRLIVIALIASAMVISAHAEVVTTVPSTLPTTRPAPRFGIILMDLHQYDDAERQIASWGGNLLVNHVFPDTRAERLGLRAGDIIQRINGKDMGTASDVISAVRAEQPIEIEILRSNGPLMLTEPSERQ